MKRIEWIDTTKAIGMVLVFYGHYVEKISHIDAENGISIMQFEFIYSFHIPFFFIISGFFAKRPKNKFDFIKKLFFQRIIPVFSFALIFIPLWLINNKYQEGNFLIKEVFIKGISYLGGSPELDFITWFLVCLFTAELFVGLFNLVSNSRTVNLILGMLFLVSGYFIIENISNISSFTGIGLNFWYIHESIIAIGFYLIGTWIYLIISKMESKMHWVFYLLIPITLFLIVLSNMYMKNSSIVIMAISRHGEFLPFAINSLLGTILIISLGIIIPPNRIMNFIGSNTLILLGLNGAFYHFINNPIAKWTFMDNSWWFITLNCILITSLSLIICYPFIFLMNKYFPQLFGKPFISGPILNSLNTFSISKLKKR
jgi:acyltransferase